MKTLTETNVRLFASAKSWIEGEALRQLYATSKLEGMRLAVGFPDLHPGKGSAVGAAFVAAGASVGAWRSLVARIVRDDEVGGSNPLATTIYG